MEEKKKSLDYSLKRLPGATFIRRARLVRRKTTVVYYDQLKRYARDEGIFIKQILIIRLKRRHDATDCEKHYLCGSNSDWVPYIEYTYPPLDEDEMQNFPPTLFYPNFMESTVLRKEDVDSFTVILTNEKGTRTYAYCFKYLTRATRNDSIITSNYAVLVFISYYPAEPLFHQLASDFVYTIQGNPNRLEEICIDLIKLRITRPEDVFKNSKYIVNTELKWSRCAISTNLKKIGIKNSIFILLNLLAERKIIVTGSKISEVSQAVQMFVKLLSPIDWPHTLIPVIPDSQCELCYNPTPYICGIMRYNLNSLKDLLCPELGTQYEIVIIDIERGIILPQFSTDSYKKNQLRTSALLLAASDLGFPKSIVSDLVKSLSEVLRKNYDYEKADFKIEQRIMTWYATLFGHYPTYCSTLPLSAKNRKCFIKAHPSPEIREFLTWFSESGVFQNFLFCQNDPKLLHPLTTRFHKILKEYSPPTDKTGIRSLERIFWRVFHRNSGIIS